VPSEDSPALDRGDTAGDFPSCDADQRGQPRDCDANTRCDIGAAERHPDLDGDTLSDCYDNCREVANADQLDSDCDLEGDVCEDLDGDGIRDPCDLCELSEPMEHEGQVLVFPNGCSPIQACACDRRPILQGRKGRNPCPRDVGPEADSPDDLGMLPWKNLRDWRRCLKAAVKDALVEPTVSESQDEACTFEGTKLSRDDRRALRARIEEDNFSSTCPDLSTQDGDKDRDGKDDATEDNCPGVYNPLQRNTDQDWSDNDWCDDEGECFEQPAKRKHRWYPDDQGDWCDPDDDGDRIPDRDDKCRRVPSKGGKSGYGNKDWDGDGCGNICDGDDDGDGIADEDDECPGNPGRCNTTSTTTVNTTSTVTSSTAP
jgi:hypothetical protein